MENGAISLLRLFIDFYSVLLLIRFLLQLVQADFFNPVSQVILKVTAPVVEPLTRIIPTIKNFNLSALCAAVLVKWSFFAILVPLGSVMPSQLGIFLIISLISLIKPLIQIYLYGILIIAISSWIGTTDHPFVRLTNQIIDPYMRPFRNIIPPIGMIDISPMIAILVLIFAETQFQRFINNLVFGYFIKAQDLGTYHVPLIYLSKLHQIIECL